MHSGGVESAIAAGSVRDLPTLTEFLRGRLTTAGYVAACFAAAACELAGNPPKSLHALAAEFEARTPSPAARDASLAQGRALLRVAAVAWPSARYADIWPARSGGHHCIVLGVVTAVAQGDPGAAALTALTAAVTGPASAAIRLLGLDPLLVTAVQSSLTTEIDELADRAARAGRLVHRGERLPARTGPSLDLWAERHAIADITFFAS